MHPKRTIWLGRPTASPQPPTENNQTHGQTKMKKLWKLQCPSFIHNLVKESKICSAHRSLAVPGSKADYRHQSLQSGAYNARMTTLDVKIFLLHAVVCSHVPTQFHPHKHNHDPRCTYNSHLNTDSQIPPRTRIQLQCSLSLSNTPRAQPFYTSTQWKVSSAWFSQSQYAFVLDKCHLIIQYSAAGLALRASHLPPPPS